MIAPDIEIDAGSTSTDANDAQHLRLFGVQDAGTLQAVACRVGRLNQRHEISKFTLDHVEPRTQDIDLLRVPVPSHPTDCNHASQQPASAERFVDAKSDLANAPGVRVGDYEADIHCDGSNIGDVIVNALELKQDRAHELCP